MTAPVVQELAGPEKIAMTAPVVQTETSTGEHVIAFVLPGSMTAESAPVPTDPQVRIRAVPERLAAVTRYSGRWAESAYRRHLAGLEAATTQAGYEPVGVARFARFDPPYTSWLLRRNEGGAGRVAAGRRLSTSHFRHTVRTAVRPCANAGHRPEGACGESSSGYGCARDRTAAGRVRHPEL